MYFASYRNDADFPLHISFIKYQLGCQHMVLLFEHEKYNTLHWGFKTLIQFPVVYNLEYSL